MMNKRIIYSVISIIIVFTVVIFVKSTGQQNTLGNSKPQNSKVTKRTTINESKYEIRLNDSGPIVSTNCIEPLNKLTGLTFREYTDVINMKGSIAEFFGKNCYKNLFKNDVYNELLKRSQCDLNSKKSFEKNNNCISFLFYLKSYLIVQESLGKDVSELSATELAAHVVKMFFELDRLNKENLDKNIGLIGRLSELYPNDPDIAQAYSGYMIIGKMITKDNSYNEKISAFLIEKEGLDFKIDRMKVLESFTNNNLEKTKEAIDNLKNKYPNEAEVSYYLAAYYWKQGDISNSKSYLNSAINNGKSCSYCTIDLYKETLKKMSTAKKQDKNLFGVSIGLNFDNI